MRECSRKRPTTDRTVMLSLMPGMPGRRQHTPRTIRSIFTPHWRRAIEHLDHPRIGDRVVLDDDVRRASRARVLALAIDQRLDALPQPDRRHQQLPEVLLV